MTDSPGKKSSSHHEDCSYDTGGPSTPRPRRGSESGSALSQHTFSKEDEQSDEDSTPTNSPGRWSRRRSSSLEDKQSSGDSTPPNSPGRRSQRKSSSLNDVLEKIPVIHGTIQKKTSRAPHNQKRLPSSSKSQKISAQENQDSDSKVENATSRAKLTLRLRNNLYDLKAILGWQESFDKCCEGKQ